MKKLKFLLANFLILFCFICCGTKSNAQSNQIPQRPKIEDPQQRYELGKALIHADDIETAKRLIDEGADVDYIFCAPPICATPLYLATRKVNIDLIKLLLDNGAKVDLVTSTSRGFTCLMEVARKGDTSIAKLLITHGANVNAQADEGDSVLLFAITANKIEMVKYLIQAGADVNVKDIYNKSLLVYAKDKGNFEIIKILKDAGAKD